MSHLARNLISDVPYWPWDLDIIPWCLSHAHHNVCKCFRLAQKLSYDRWFSDENFRVFGDFSALVRTLLQVISTAVAVYDRLQLESWRAAEAGKSCNLVPAKVSIWSWAPSLDQYQHIIIVVSAETKLWMYMYEVWSQASRDAASHRGWLVPHSKYSIMTSALGGGWGQAKIWPNMMRGRGDKWDSDVIFGPTILDMLNVALHSLTWPAIYVKIALHLTLAWEV